jgi:hypothetical protein
MELNRVAGSFLHMPKEQMKPPALSLAEPGDPPIKDPLPYQDPASPPPADPQEDRPLSDPQPPGSDVPRL